MSKNMISVVAQSGLCGDFDGETLADVQIFVEQLISRHGAGAQLSVESHSDYEDGHYVSIEVVVIREETDVEYEKRIKREEGVRASQEARDLFEFKRLQEKFKGK
jgi:hypothetical protein